MKKIFILLLIIIFLVVGYALGNLFPINTFLSTNKGIAGNTKLQVKLITQTGSPVSDVEVDIAQTPGAPPPGGTETTDTNGIANFTIKPGTYFLYFNTMKFPSNLEVPREKQIQVVEGKTNEEVVTLVSK